MERRRETEGEGAEFSRKEEDRKADAGGTEENFERLRRFHRAADRGRSPPVEDVTNALCASQAEDNSKLGKSFSSRGNVSRVYA